MAESMLALTHMNGGVIEVFTCAECLEPCEQVPIHITGWTERFFWTGTPTRQSILPQNSLLHHMVPGLAREQLVG